jgi:hypothetical protein
MTTTTPAPRRTLRARTGGFAVTATAAGLILSGCTADPAPTASTPATTTTAAVVTPQPIPTLDAEQIALALQDRSVTDAKAAYLNYGVVFDEIQKDGMANWQRIMPLIGGDLLDSIPGLFERKAQLDERATGDTVTVSQALVEYTPDPTGAGNERLVLDVCLDTSAVDVFTPDGRSVLQADYPKRLITTATMQHQSDGRWTVASEQTDVDRPC